MDSDEIIVAAKRARAQAMRRGDGGLWRRSLRLPDVAHARVQDVVGVGAGEVAVVAEVKAGALGDRGVGAQPEHTPSRGADAPNVVKASAGAPANARRHRPRGVGESWLQPSRT